MLVERDGPDLRTPMEVLIGGIWREVLGRERIGRDDNFFDLGGHSLLALRLIARISKTVRQSLSVKFLFVNPTVADQARELERQGPSSAPATSLRNTTSGDPRTQSLVIRERPDLDGTFGGDNQAVDAVALGYLSSEMARALGWTLDGMMSRWFDSGRPVLDGVIETRWGRIGGISLPYSDGMLYDDGEGLVKNIVLALRMARRLGAKMVTMTGLIPSATDSGSAVLRAMTAERIAGLPALSTGHATTSAGVVLNIQRVALMCGRDLSAERVAFVGLGSIGLTTLRLMLACAPHPREIILCDVYSQLERLGAIRDELRMVFQFRGSIHVAWARGEIPAEAYEASLIVGATNVPEVLDIKRVRPGTVIVDDSAPHCFSTASAIARFEESADIIFTEGGVLGLPEPLRETAYHPPNLKDPTDLGRFAEFLGHDSTSITGCVFSGLLSGTFGLRPTIGPVAAEEALAHYSALVVLGFTGGRLQCDSYVLRQDLVERFRRAFGGF